VSPSFEKTIGEAISSLYRSHAKISPQFEGKSDRSVDSVENQKVRSRKECTESISLYHSDYPIQNNEDAGISEETKDWERKSKIEESNLQNENGTYKIRTVKETVYVSST
jgi:hypothetical protein